MNCRECAPKMKFLLFFIPNLYDFLSSVKQKNRC